MAITRMKRFAASKKPYAIDWDSFEVDTKEITRSDGSKIDFSTVQVNAVWVGRKDGRTYVSAGQLWDSEAVSSMTRDEFMANFDPRYGGRVEARWNGHDLWAPGASFDEVVEWRNELEPVLDGLPEVPQGYDGWYSLR